MNREGKPTKVTFPNPRKNNKLKLSIKDIIIAVPFLIGVVIISILWFPIALYKSIKHSDNAK
tara:strand:- start:2 stop:187 length:186 start_codon:yes stop_codon:yes gene_type:complete